MPDTAITTTTVGVDACHAMAPVSCSGRWRKSQLGWAKSTMVINDPVTQQFSKAIFYFPFCVFQLTTVCIYLSDKNEFSQTSNLAHNSRTTLWCCEKKF